jgi:hypothetical protein
MGLSNANPQDLAIPIYAKRKINGYTVETVVEVTCGPRYTY